MNLYLGCVLAEFRDYFLDGVTEKSLFGAYQ